jgi:hypothetical protein
LVLGESASGETRTGVRLSGSVNPENSLAFYQFQYGTSASYGSSTGEAQAGSGLGEVTVGPTTIGELQPGTTYHYRLLVSNGSGTTAGEDETFTTLPPTPPIVSTGVDQIFTTPTYPALTFPLAIAPPPKSPAAPKALTRAQKLAKALKACKRERNPRKRASCVKRAKRRYGARKAKKGKRNT